MAQDSLYGFWKLATLRFVMKNGDWTEDMYGPDPVGYLVLTAEGRMMAIITSKDRDQAKGEADLFRTMMAYSGPFRIEGGTQFITLVESAWHPDWVGTEQARTFSIQGDVLLISTAEITHPKYPDTPGRAVLEWHSVVQP